MAWLDEVLGRQKPKAHVIQVRPIPGQQLDADATDFRLGKFRKLQEWAAHTSRWGLEKVDPALAELRRDVRELKEQRMAIPAELQDLGQQVAEVLTELRETRTTLDAQTDKYKSACDDRDAALERERIAAAERDEVKAELERLGQIIASVVQRGSVGAKTAV